MDGSVLELSTALSGVEGVFLGIELLNSVFVEMSSGTEEVAVSTDSLLALSSDRTHSDTSFGTKYSKSCVFGFHGLTCFSPFFGSITL